MNNTFYDYILKFIVIGDSSVGKSNLLLQFTDKRFEHIHYVTIGVEFNSKIISYDDTIYNIQVWDTTGQETYKSITKFYYRDTLGCLLVYDITNRKSFEGISKWLEEIKEVNTNNTSIILVGNKLDLNGKRTVSYEEGKNFAIKHNIGFIETSAKTGLNVQKAFIETVSEIDKKIKNKTIDMSDKNIGINISNNVAESSYSCYC